MIDISLNQILLTLGWLIGFGLLLLGGRYGVSWLRIKVGATQFDQINAVVQNAVLAAEQMLKNGDLAKDERFKFVLGIVQGYFPKVTQEMIEVYIEAAVAALNLALRDAPAPAPALEYFTGGAEGWTRESTLDDATIERIADAVALAILKANG